MRSSSSSSSSTGTISIASSAQKIDVDNRISLRYYYRIADNLLKQAAIYRQEKNIIDLYVILLRFSSLVTETIPRHRDCHISHQGERTTFKKKLLNVLSELEMLKPDVQRLLEEMNAKSRSQVSRWDPNDTQNTSLEWPPVTKQSVAKYEVPPVGQESRGLYSYGAPISQNGSSKLKFNQDQFRKYSLSIPRATEETLSRHSILGPNGLYGQWQPPRIDRGVQYPSNLDLSSIEIPCLEPQNKAEPALVQGVGDSEVQKSDFESVLSLNDDVSSLKIDQPCSIGNQDNKEAPDKLDIIRQPSPPPVLADIQDLVPATSPQVSQTISGSDNGLQDELIRSKGPLELHISTTMMDTFMRLAKSNTQRNLETCGVLAGSLKNRKFHVTGLIIPKQESTSDSCQTTNEEEIFDYQDKESLFPLGWIHTHPTQSCFMSSIDVHTHYSYQIMLPESIAIVMAPRDPSRKHGIFRLTSPGGMSVIRQCDRRGFHPHEPPADGGPIYDKCSDVYLNPNLKFDVVDFR